MHGTEDTEAYGSERWSRFVSRRSFLKGIGGTAAAVSGGALLAACNSSDGGAGGTDVTLSVSTGGPYGPMPSQKDQKAAPGVYAYAQALQEWFDKHPGVKFKTVNVDVWNQEAITAALSGGTAPAAFISNVIGGWDYAAIRSAFLQGLAADVTDLVAESKMIDKLEDYAKPIWENVWSVEGRYYAAPNAYNVGPGIHYRRDLIQELGLPEPQPGWTWSDVRELAKALTKGKRKGIAMQGLGFSSSVNAEGFEFLSTIPAPETSWNWRRDYMRNVDHWVQIIGDVRAMKFEDQSLLSDITFHDGEIWNAFIREQACMHTNTVVFYTSEPSAGTTHVTLADKLGKPLEEVVGWVPFPVGRNGYASSGFTQPQIDSVSFSPDLDEEELALIFDLHLYMIGDGFVKQKNIVYDKTKDLREIYNFDKITPVLKGTLDGMPGSPDEAWGKQFMDTVRAVTQYPLIPQTAWFFPPEEQVGPTTNAIDDAFSKWWFEPGEVDIAADLERAQNVLNTQAESFTSSVPDEEFVSAANKYYAAHEKFWQQHSPEFYENVFRPFYEEAIKPALSG